MLSNFATINIQLMNKRTIISLLLLLVVGRGFAFTSYPTGEPDKNTSDSIFVGRFVNEELKIFLVINFYDKNVTVKDQDILGELDGYFGCTECQHVWPIVDAQINNNVVDIDVINNYGSEDFRAKLTRNEDGTLSFRHIEGSTFKFPIPGKWHKIPTKLTFTRIK